MGKTINAVDWVCILLYVLGLLGIAVYHSRKMRRQDDVFLAGRSMSRWPIAISMYMALFSTNTFLGVTGWLNRPNGTIWIGMQTIGIMLAVPFVVTLYPTLFYRLRITSAYEYLEKRFNRSVRSVATVFFLSSRIMWMSTMLYSSSLVVSTMLGWTATFGVTQGQLMAILTIGALATFFTLVGGMHAVIWTDVFQFFVLLAGLIAMIVLGLALTGGVGQIVEIANEHGKFDPPAVFSLMDDFSLLGGLLLGFVGMLANSGADQVVLQQYLTAKNDKEAKASLWRNGLFLKPVSLIYPFLGVLMFAFYKAHPDVGALVRIPDDALPVFVVNVLPAGARALMIVAMVAAVLTSIESGLTAMSAAIQVDYVRRWMKRPLGDREAVRTARALLLTSGLAIIGGACWVRTLGEKNNILQILNIVMYPFTGVLLGIFLLGILVHRVNARGALVGAVVGFLGTVAVPGSKQLIPILSALGISLSPGLVERIETLGGISNFYYGCLGTLATILVGYLASLPFPPPSAEKITGLTRWSLPEPLEKKAELAKVG